MDLTRLFLSLTVLGLDPCYRYETGGISCIGWISPEYCGSKEEELWGRNRPITSKQLEIRLFFLLFSFFFFFLAIPILCSACLSSSSSSSSSFSFPFWHELGWIDCKLVSGDSFTKFQSSLARFLWLGATLPNAGHSKSVVGGFEVPPAWMPLMQPHHWNGAFFFYMPLSWLPVEWHWHWPWLQFHLVGVRKGTKMQGPCQIRLEPGTGPLLPLGPTSF